MRTSLFPWALVFAIMVSLTWSCGKHVDLRIRGDKAYETLKELRAAENKFRSGVGRGRWGSLKQLVDAGLMKNDLIDGVREGYKFVLEPENDSYSVTVVPVEGDERSLRYFGMSFFMDSTGVIRGRSYGRGNGYTAATKDDEILTNQM